LLLFKQSFFWQSRALEPQLMVAGYCRCQLCHLGVFTPSSRALERLKELDASLRKDTPERQYVHFYLGQQQALQSHIIPLTIACNNEGPVIFLCLKIFTRLTMALPANVDNYLQRLTQLHDAKQAIINGDVIAVLMSWMGELFTNAPSERKRSKIFFFVLEIPLLFLMLKF